MTQINTDHNDLTIMVIDDSSTNNLLLEAVFESEKYSVIAAEDAISAMTMLQHYKPDLIVLDIMMPGVNGFELLEQLKEKEETKEIPVIILTAKQDGESKKRALDLGAIDYFVKPIDKKELLYKVSMCFNKRI